MGNESFPQHDDPREAQKEYDEREAFLAQTRSILKRIAEAEESEKESST